MRTLNAQRFGLTVDAHQTTWLDVDVLDTAFLLGELCMVADLSRRFRKQERTAVALGTIAVGMSELVGRVHAQPPGAQRYAVSIALRERIVMLIQGNGGDAATADGCLIRIPGIEGRISNDMRGKKA